MDFGEARLTLALSAEVWRGFSGEGQALWALMQADGGEVGATLSRVRAKLQWQAALEAPTLARELKIDVGVVEDVLRVAVRRTLPDTTCSRAAIFIACCHSILRWRMNSNRGWRMRRH